MEIEDDIKNALWAIVILLVIAAIFAGRTRAFRDAGQEKRTRRAAACEACITMNNNNQILRVAPGTRIGLSLPYILYDPSLLFGDAHPSLEASRTQDDGDPFTWERSYVASAPGRTLLRVPPKKLSNPEFHIEIEVVPTAPIGSPMPTALR